MKTGEIIENGRRENGFKEVDVTGHPYSNFKPSEKWKGGHRYNLENEDERKKTIDRLLKIIEQKTPQKECSFLSSCTYLREGITLEEITNLEAYGYLTLVCERYPGACELNLNG